MQYVIIPSDIRGFSEIIAELPSNHTFITGIINTKLTVPMTVAIRLKTIYLGKNLLYGFAKPSKRRKGFILLSIGMIHLIIFHKKTFSQSARYSGKLNISSFFSTFFNEKRIASSGLYFFRYSEKLFDFMLNADFTSMGIMAFDF